MPDNPDLYVRTKIFCSCKELESTLELVQSTFNNKFEHDNEVCAIVDEDKIEEIETLIDTLNEDVNDNQYASAHYTSAFIKLLIYIDKYALRYTPSPKTFFSSAISYINSNLNDKITVDEIAEVCHMSKYYFCRRFKQIVGYTVMEYILNTRLANAKVLLTSTDLAISEISERCGFSGFSYFSRVFKENCGITPNEFRKRGVVLESLTTNKK
jgi:AraC-like DNA-binding protein